MSESQERMMAVVEPGRRRRVHGDLPQVGRARDRRRRGHRGRPADHRLARRDRRRRRPADRRARGPGLRAPVRPPGLAGRGPGQRRRTTWPARRPATSWPTPCCGWSPRPNLCDKSWITDQYDRYVRGNSVLAQPEDAGMLRIDEETGLGVALATDCNGRFALLDPYAGAQLALAEAYRNVAVQRRGAGRDHRLPELRLARGPGDHVAVHPGDRRPGRRLPGARHPGDRRATSASTTRPARPRSCRPRSSA